MSFATDHLDQLARFAQHGPLPRVHALHLPPDPTPGDSRGEFCAIELDDGSLGLSYVLLDDTLQRLRQLGPALSLGHANALQVARHCVDERGAQRTIGFAAANALTRCLYECVGWRPEARLNPRPGESIGMIGLFTPVLARLRAIGAQLTVLVRRLPALHARAQPRPRGAGTRHTMRLNSAV